MLRTLILLSLALLGSGCTNNINLGPDYEQPMQEQLLAGDPKGKFKVVVIPVSGMISNSAQEGFLQERPSMVDDITRQLNRASLDSQVGAVVLRVDSPGGTVTASDMLYHEIMRFKQRTGKPVVVSMMDMATSGGYYLSLAADEIDAHPTTITGSVGVIFIQPQIDGLLGKLGVSVNVYKSGRNKDMGSPLRAQSEEDQQLLQGMIDQAAERFYTLVQKHRHLNTRALDITRTARALTSQQALDLGLIDHIRYLSDTLEQACSRGLHQGKQCKVVSYRYGSSADTSYYSSQAASHSPQMMSNPLPLDHMARSGMYYLWQGAD